MSRQEKKERRRHKRHPLKFSGRYMLEDGPSDYPCRTENVSATGIFLRGFRVGEVGEWVVTYLDQLGRVEGAIVRTQDSWFAFEIAAPPAKMQKLATKVDSLAAAVSLSNRVFEERMSVIEAVRSTSGGAESCSYADVRSSFESTFWRRWR
jgi:hypothetical protein